MPAGRVLGVIVIALVIAWLFNSEALVRAGEGMKPGTTRDIVLSVGRPVDDVAGAVGLHLPREGLDLAFGQEERLRPARSWSAARRRSCAATGARQSARASPSRAPEGRSGCS